MFAYVRSCLTRPPLWAAGAACALLVALPGALAATMFVRPLTMLVLTADPLLAMDVMPGYASRPSFVAAAVVGLVVLVLVYHRMYAVVLWESDERNESGWLGSWRATRSRWTRYLMLNATLLSVLAAAVGLLVLAVGAARGSPGTATITLLLGVGVIVGLRAIGRIFVTLAARGGILDDQPLRDSWRRAREIVKKRRREVVAVWSILVALGAAVWLGGRLVTPILQDTALDFPAHSTYAVAREAVQVAVALPLETTLLLIGAALWTGLYRQIEAERPQPIPSPLLPRVLAASVVLALIGNGIPAMLDVSWRDSRDSALAAVDSASLSPEDQLRSAAPAEAAANSYVVDARLEGRTLRWKTGITYRNESSRALQELPVQVYTAAFARELEDLPLADEILAGSSPASTRAQVERGTFEVVGVSSGSRDVQWDRSDATLTLELERAIPPGGEFQAQISLEADLPAWPLRFGTWNELVQLGNWIPTVPPMIENSFVVHPYGDIGDPFVASAADYDVTIEVDDPAGVVGTGSLVDATSIGSGRSRWRFVARDVRDAAFAIGRGLRAVERSAAGASVRTWYSGGDAEVAKEVADDAASAYAWFSEAFGASSLDEVDLVLMDSPVGGMEYPGLVYLSTGFAELEGLPVVPELFDHAGFDSDLRRYVTGHELAHQWWYADVGNDQAEQPWLDEALAEASTQLWLESVPDGGRATRVAHLERPGDPVQGAIDASVADFSSNSRYVETVYEGGAAILLALRLAVGRGRFEQTLAEWHRRYRGDIGTIDEFVEVVRDVAGSRGSALLQRYRR